MTDRSRLLASHADDMAMLDQIATALDAIAAQSDELVKYVDRHVQGHWWLHQLLAIQAKRLRRLQCCAVHTVALTTGRTAGELLEGE